MKRELRFEKHFQASTFHNPLLNNELDTQTLEIRRDPLTGSQSVYNPALKDKIAVFIGHTDRGLVERLAEASRATCFLCDDRWERTTPKYPEAQVPGGRIRIGQAVLFPNLFPVAQIHAVIRVGDAHYLPLREFDPARILEALQACRMFVGALARTSPTVTCLTLNGNYLGPAGASIAHPHFQVVGGDLPCTWLERVLARSRTYLREEGSCYWKDLVETEKSSGARFAGETGPVCWLTPFAPKGTNEVMGIVPGCRSFLELDDADLEGLAVGLCRVLAAYDSMGISTFNFSIYSGPLGTSDDAFRCLLRIISRQNVYENYRTDDYFLQKLLRNELILTLPETLATTLRPFLAGTK